MSEIDRDLINAAAKESLTATTPGFSSDRTRTGKALRRSRQAPCRFT
jgi:hypothetical protein